MRAKIIIPNLLIMLILGAGAYFYLRSALTRDADARLEKQVHMVAGLFDRSEALRGYEMLNDVRRRAMSRSMAGVFGALDLPLEEGESTEAHEGRIRQAWFKRAVTSIETHSELLSDAGQKPALLFITDRNGVVLARNTTPNACPAGKRVDNAIPVVRRALDGEASYAIWSVDKSPFDRKTPTKNSLCSLINTGLLEMAAAPIWSDADEVAGALVVGFEVSNGTASEKSALLGLDLAVLSQGQVYSTSLEGETAREKLNASLLHKETKTLVGCALKQRKQSRIFSLHVEGRDYRAILSPAVNSEPHDRIALLYMSAVDVSRPFTFALSMLLAFFLFASLFVIIAGFRLTAYFMKPIMAIEEGLLKIINGDYEYRFDVESAEVGGLSYRINQLVNELTGKDESNDDSN